MPRAKLLRAMDPGERRVLEFDFTKDIGAETISNFDAVTVSVYRGVDPTPSNLLFGPTSQSGVLVFQEVDGTLAVPNVDYKFRARVTTSSTRKLVLTGILPVRDA